MFSFKKYIKPITHKDYLFLFALIIIHIIVAHGKVMALIVFQQTHIAAILATPITLPMYVMMLLGSFCFFSLKVLDVNPYTKVIIGAVIGFIVVIVMSAILQSIIISSLMLFCYIVATCVVFVDDYLDENMEIEFWKILFESGIKGIQFVIALFGIAMLLVRFLSNGIHESQWGFLSTFFSAMIGLGSITFLFTNWVLLPCWGNLVKGYHKNRKE